MYENEKRVRENTLPNESETGVAQGKTSITRKVGISRKCQGKGKGPQPGEAAGPDSFQPFQAKFAVEGAGSGGAAAARLGELRSPAPARRSRSAAAATQVRRSAGGGDFAPHPRRARADRGPPRLPLSLSPPAPVTQQARKALVNFLCGLD